MGDFLDSLPFLSPEQRATLRAQDLDTVDAFGHLTITDSLGKLLATPTDVLMAPPFGLTLGKASRLLAAAKGEAPAPAQPPQTLVVNIAEPPDLRTRIERALLLAEQDPSTVGALADLGVDLVVQGEHGKVWPAATMAMRAHASTGAPRRRPCGAHPGTAARCRTARTRSPAPHGPKPDWTGSGSQRSATSRACSRACARTRCSA